jgi:hypothetical protein
MNAITQWFQDWSDACEYAGECWPDLSFATFGEPYTALLGIGCLCAGLWWFNERRIRARRARQPRALSASTTTNQETLAISPERLLTTSTQQQQAA